ncbi:vitellogenin 3, phosvitinless [Alosa sapidissima]|uniref:vitellogenin 3, phosvitinless n=1 Tax=Alosa sapidissima TaxID=34773 RepID=UPI001C0973EE|nr:vitellogenin 3, phosvitinless [Alosa sapidissima]XP_041912176.1 vitellogenin 3, phosvitinless [Alosa sapidissima]XP_041912177.1 vitellogenin 3, phosvitinless [Alosa sapidissima]
MQGLVLCVLFALAACQSLNFEPTLNPKKTYEFKYEGAVSIGRGMPDLAESGVRLTCNAKITGISAQMFLLQVSNLAFEEFNGIPGKNVFYPSPKLTQRMASELSKPLMFEYVKGRVVDIQAATGVSDTVVNIVRGMLGFFQVTVKTTQKVYELEELGIHGLCKSSYVIEEDEHSTELSVTQVVDIRGCRQRAEISTGMALAIENELSKQRGERIVATVQYTYTVKGAADGGLITKARAQEYQHFSPFDIKGGNSKLLATKSIELLKVTDSTTSPSAPPAQSRGNLVYKFGTNLQQMPIVLMKLDNPLPKITEMIKKLAQANIYQVDSPTSEDIVSVIQLLRAVTLEDLETLWKQLSGNLEHRRWFLDLITEVTDERVVKFLLNRFRVGDVSPNEAGQTLLVSINHLTVTPEVVEMSKEFIKIPFSKSHPILWHTVVLSYGSLVYKLCAYIQPCPATAIQPLLDMATGALERNSEEEMVESLEAIGNAGHPSSIKTIIKFLPGISPKAVDLPNRVVSSAVQSLRHITVRDPHTVQDIALSLVVTKTLPAEIRIHAAIILFETKPPLSLLLMITSFLLEEKDAQVVSFIFSLIRGLSRSHTPENHQLSTVCNIAVKILEPKLGRFSFYNSKYLHLDWFSGDLLMGTSTEGYIIKNSRDKIPTALMIKGKFHFIGRILQLLEFGVRAEGLRELFSESNSELKDIDVTDYAAIMKILSDMKSLPKDKPILTLYSRLFGQEWFFADLDKDIIQQIIKALSPTAGKECPAWQMIQDLQKGISWHWTKPFMVFETRLIQATTLGLPVEISKNYPCVSAITANAKATISPPLKEHLGELLSSDITLETDGFAGVTKDHFVFHGINTEFFQCGSELKSKTPINMPWKFTLKMNIKERKFEIDFNPPKKVTELFAVNVNIFAVSRNIEEPSLSKMTPMMPKSVVTYLPPHFPKTSEDEFELADVYHPQSKVCLETSLYGTALCVENEIKRTHYASEYPLYYFLGYTHLAIQLEPVKTKKPVDKIQIKINPGLKDNIPSLHQIMEMIHWVSKNSSSLFNLSSTGGADGVQSSEPQFLESTPDPMLVVKALALGEGVKPEGYEAAVYYLPAVQKDNVELIVSQLGMEANWKMCGDAHLDKAEESAKVYLRWGAECQSYDVAVVATKTYQAGTKPAVTAKVKWDNLPEYVTNAGKSVEDYIPGMSLLLGFCQRHDANTAHEVSVSIVRESAQSLDIELKTPQLTVYRQGIFIPIQMMNFQKGRNMTDTRLN